MPLTPHERRKIQKKRREWLALVPNGGQFAWACDALIWVLDNIPTTKPGPKVFHIKDETTFIPTTKGKPCRKKK